MSNLVATSSFISIPTSVPQELDPVPLPPTISTTPYFAFFKSPTSTVKPRTSTAKSPASPAKSRASTPKSPTSTAKPRASTPKSPTSTAKSRAATPKSPTSTAKSHASTPKSPTSTAKSRASTPKSPTSTAKSRASTPKSPTSTATSRVSTPKSPTPTAKSPTSTITPRTSTASTSIPTSTFTTTPTPAASKPRDPPIAAIVGALAGALIIIIAILVWFNFRRRRQRQNATHPKPSSKEHESSQYDLEQQQHPPREKKQQAEKSRSIPETEKSAPDIKPDHNLTSVRIDNDHNTTPNVQYNISSPPSTPSPQLHGDASFSSKPSSLHPISLNNNDHKPKAKKPFYKRQASSSQSQTKETTSAPHYPPPQPPPVATNTPMLIPETVMNAERLLENRRKTLMSAVQLQPKDIHIDTVDMDLEKLLPIVISDEILSINSDTPPQEAAQTGSKEGNTSSAPTTPTTSIMPTHTPRRPPLGTRRSTDTCITGGRARLSTCHPPPPPPPTVPPPAIPLTYPGDTTDGRNRNSTDAATRGSLYSVSSSSSANARGRRPRTSTESNPSQSAGLSSIRSISLDSRHRLEDHRDPTSKSRVIPHTNGGGNSRPSKKIIQPPSTPPPVAVPQHQKQLQSPVHGRHQRTPSQLLSTGLFASSDRAPLSPLSPPLSPLTVQVPRPSSRSYQTPLSSSVYYPTSNSRSGSPTTGSNPNSRPSASTRLKAHDQQAKSKNIVIASATSSASSSPTPGSTAQKARQSYLPLHRSSLVQRQSSGSIEGSAPSSPGGPSQSPSHFEDGPGLSGGENLMQEQRRSTSLDLWMRPNTQSQSPGTGRRFKHRSNDANNAIMEREENMVSSRDPDQELQDIIADALAIVAAKTAAMEAARQSPRHSQMMQGHRQQDDLVENRQPFQSRQKSLSAQQQASHSHSRPWTPAEVDPWASTAPTSSTSSSRSASPFYSTTTSS
ncbi:hypothetical protein BGZ51_008217 [Haplosporangium sp. Z 767]|nr:hypothetical protein BGZ50_004847 [Haplosporangium sp. Z 11]KAF9190815.1 hypothetical protein BGZ51_008217 [Haplosporangium sp. Z 767]